jgi:NADH-quinone oxidoreductase subunit C
MTDVVPEGETTPVDALPPLVQLGQLIQANANGAIYGFKVEYGELTLLAERERICEVLTHLKDDPDCKFHQLVDICGADYPERERRFDVVYHLLSMIKNHRIRVKVQTDEDTAVPTATSVFAAADWFEREAFDMYGIFFDNHPDLRRLLPMTGYVEVRYDDELKRVVYEPVKLTQEFRQFDFLSPWEGARNALPGTGYHYTLPGDEKAAK